MLALSGRAIQPVALGRLCKRPAGQRAAQPRPARDRDGRAQLGVCVVVQQLPRIVPRVKREPLDVPVGIHDKVRAARLVIRLDEALGPLRLREH